MKFSRFLFTVLLLALLFPQQGGAQNTLAGNLLVQGTTRFSGDITASITGNQNDFNPTGLATATVVRVSSDAPRSITGLQGGADGRWLFIVNSGAHNLTLVDESASSTAANRFALVENYIIQPDASVELLYDSIASRWRVAGSHSNSGSLAGLGAGVADALAKDVGTNGAVVLFNGALGTPTSGTLTNATGLPIAAGTTGTLGPTRGGTGLATYATGDTLYASAADTLARLSGNALTAKRFLTQSGNGTTPSAPAWSAVLDADLPTALTGKTYEGLTFTELTTGFSIAGGSSTEKTVTFGNTLTFSGTDGSTLNIGAGGVLGSAAFTATSAYANASQGAKIDAASAVTGILKGNGVGGFTAAVAGTDYATPSVGSSLIAGNGSGGFNAVTVDTSLSYSSQTLSLPTVNASPGTFGSATQTVTATVDAKGRITALSAQTATPAVTSVTGMGTGVQAALQVNVGAAGAPVLFNGALGTPSSGTLTNATGLPIVAGTTGTLTADRGGTGLTALSANVVSLLGAANYAAVKTQLSLNNVDNTSDVNKPISTATQAALDSKAPLASPTFTGTPLAPTAAPGTDTTQIATTQFVRLAVDAATQALDVKTSVRAIATSNIILSGAQTIDGVSVIAGDRVLVAGQTTASQNGIYVVASGAWTRATDADTSADVTSGLFTFVSEGTNYASMGFVLTTPEPIVLGTTALSFTQFSGAGQIIAGTGLIKSGNTLSTANIPNASLTNSSITIGNAGAIALGGSASLDSITGLSSNGLVKRTAANTYAAAVSGTDYVAPSAYASTNGLTMTTARLLGRTTAGTGPAEEISVGASLSFSAGTLQLPDTITAGSVGSSTAIPVLTYDAKGRLTAASTAAVVAPAGTLTGTTLAANVVTSSLTTVGALNSGSITSGFGSIDIGTDTLAAGNTTITGTLSLSGMLTNTAATGEVLRATSGTTGSKAIRLGVNAGVNSDVYFGTEDSTGSFFGATPYAAVIYNAVNTPVEIFVNATKRASVTSTGINNTVIGATTPAAGSFTTLSATGQATFTAGSNAIVVNNAGGDSRMVFQDNGVTRLIFGISSVTDGIITGSVDGSPVFRWNTGSALFSADDGVTAHLAISSSGLSVTGTLTATSTFYVGSQLSDMTTGTADGFSAYSSGDFYASGNGLAPGRIRRRTSDGSIIIFYRDTTSVGSISVTTTSTAYNTSSDARLKTNVRPIENSGAILDALKPRLFDWKSGEKDSYGFIAQEVYAVFPQAVTKGDDGEEVTRQWAMDPAKLVPLLTAEIKSLRARVRALETRQQ